MPEENNFKKDTISVGINSVFLNIFGVLTSIVVARSLGPEKQGIVALVLLVVDLLSRFVNFGTQTAVVYFLHNNTYSPQKILSNLISISLLVSIIATIFTAVLWRPDMPAISIFSYPGSYIAVIFVCLFMVINFLRINLSSYFNARQNYRLTNFYNLLNSGILAVVFLIAFIIGRLNLEVIFSAYIVASVIGLAASLIGCIQSGLKLNLELDLNLVKNFLRYGIPVYLTSVTAFLQQRINIILVNSLMGLASVGYFSIAYNTAEKISELGNPMILTHSPKANQLKNVSTEEAVSFTSGCFSKLFAIYLILLLPYCALLYFLIPIFYSKTYSPSIVPAMILVLAIIFWSLSRIMNNLYAALALQKINAAIMFIAVAVNLLAIYLVLLTAKSLIAVSVVMIISYGLTLLMQIGYLKIRYKINFKDFAPDFAGAIRSSKMILKGKE